MTLASPFCTAPKSLIRETLEVVSLAGGPKLLRAGALLSDKGTMVPDRSYCDSHLNPSSFPTRTRGSQGWASGRAHSKEVD